MSLKFTVIPPPSSQREKTIIYRVCTEVEDVSGGVNQCVEEDGVADYLMQQDVLVQR